MKLEDAIDSAKKIGVSYFTLATSHPEPAAMATISTAASRTA